MSFKAHWYPDFFVRVWSCIHLQRTKWRGGVCTDDQPDTHSRGESQTREQVRDSDIIMSKWDMLPTPKSSHFKLIYIAQYHKSQYHKSPQWASQSVQLMTTSVFRLSIWMRKNSQKSVTGRNLRAGNRGGMPLPGDATCKDIVQRE